MDKESILKNKFTKFRSLQFDDLTKQEYLNNAGLTRNGVPSEVDVLLLRSDGYTLMQIAQKFNCSDRTVERRIKNIKLKILNYELKLLLLEN